MFKSFSASSQNYMINNFNRGKFVVIKTNAEVNDPTTVDSM